MEGLLWISDAGHAWLRVPLEEGLKYGTGYGYMKGEYAYLEEDCEAPAFLKDHPEIDNQEIPEEDCGGYWIGRGFQNIPEYKGGDKVG